MAVRSSKDLTPRLATSDRHGKGHRGSILLAVLLAGVVLSLVAAALLTAAVGAGRTSRRAGEYGAATALAQAVIAEVRLYPAGDPRLEQGEWDWCPPECPDRVDRVTVSVSRAAGQPEGVRRVTVSVYRTGIPDSVQVVSYVYP